MIKTIRIRFIRVALIALTVAMIFVAAMINFANWVSVRQEMDDTITLLVQYDGQIANIESAEYNDNDGDDKGSQPSKSRHSRESIYESRYFSIIYTEDGEYSIHDMSQIVSYTEDDAIELAQAAVESGKTSGFIDSFLYTIYYKDGAYGIIFLDCETKLSALRSLMWISVIACLLGISMAWGIVALASKRMIRPLIESAEKQKRFITDAGHELKTPLTVISANMELLTMDVGENEWVESTQKQVGTMRSLVSELVFLSRMDEDDVPLPRQKFNVSDAVEEAASPFSAMAEFQGKAFNVSVQKDIQFEGDESALRRLVSVLCDNALKYAPENDTITVKLMREGKRIILSTENTLTEPMDDKTRSHLFDRFYRADESRTKTDRHSGYGIGLAVAKAVVEKHGGKIEVKTEDGTIRFTCTFS